MRDDVFFEGDAARQSDPAFLAFDATATEWKPFVLTLEGSDEFLHRVWVAINVHMSSH